LQAGRLTTVCELQGNLFFGTTDRLFTELEPDLKRSRTVILDMRRVQSVDFTAAHMLEQFEALLAERGAHLVFSSLPRSCPADKIWKATSTTWASCAPAKNVKIFSTLDDALEWTEDRTLERSSPSRRRGMPAPGALASSSWRASSSRTRPWRPCAPVCKKNSFQPARRCSTAGTPAPIST